MGSGNWFKTIVGLKKSKNKRSKQAKVHSANKKSNESNSSPPMSSSHLTGPDSSSSPADGASGSEKAAVLRRLVEEIAAMRIQAAFRAHVERRAVQSLKGAVKFQGMIEAHTARKQASATLSHIHFWSNIQAQIRARRMCMVTEGQLRQKKLENQLKLEAKLRQIEEEWCGGAETMEEIISRVHQREEAAVKRERAMAYAFSHQWRANSGQYFGQAYYDLGKESWGWSWKERWIAVRPWETRVHAQPIASNKARNKSGRKGAKSTDPPVKKILVSVQPNSSNGRATTTKQAPTLC